MGQKAIIIGAGIGGLATAIALEAAGWEVAVYEQAATLEPMGAGLSIWRNAVDALEQLGCGPALVRMTQPLERVQLARRDGRAIATIDTARLIPGASARTATRTDIQTMLLERQGETPLHTGHVLAGFAQDAGGVSVRFANGVSARGDLLVAADGIRSQIAAAVVGDAVYHAGYGGVLALSDPVAGNADRRLGVEHAAPGERLGVFGLTGGCAYWFYMCNERDPAQSHRITLDHVRTRLTGWTEAARAPVEATPADRLIPFSIHAKPPPKRLGLGRIICVGDAAHAMEPNLGQGACQALEDAVALGWAARGRPAEAILPVYEAMRLKRVRTIVTLARQGAILAHRLPPPLFGVGAWMFGALAGAVMPQTRAIYRLPDYQAMAGH
jgi:2-polyprenyl-6-methoxyphenol hydroxylase-like FAD-dependent oxidoreductase